MTTEDDSIVADVEAVRLIDPFSIMPVPSEFVLWIYIAMGLKDKGFLTFEITNLN